MKGEDQVWRTDLAKLLRELREGAGVTQAELAIRLGTQQSFVSKYEVGERRIDVVELYSICNALGASFPALAARVETVWKGNS